jgi:peptidoglycan/xylan/chitin deacetylase (PgdA/CDA1 family)
MDLKEFWGPHKGAVSLTFDDGSPDHLERAIPRLNEYDIRGTFYLLGGGDRWREQLAPWVAAARQGHEIGNHSLTHTCSNSHDGGNRGLEYRSLQQMEDEILKTQERLSSVFTEQKDWTYCYPCYNLMVGRGTTKQSYTPVIAKHFLAGRAGGEFGLANHPAGVDLSCVT